MKFTRNVVLSIIQEHFEDEVYENTSRCVMDLNSDELEEDFDGLVDYAELDGIYEIDATDIEVEENDDVVTVMGILEVDASIEMYYYWDRENHHVGSAEKTLGFEFSFEVYDGEYGAFHMAYAY